ESDLLGHGHENRVILGHAEVAGPQLLLGLLLQEQEACEDVDVRFDDEDLDGQVDAVEHPRVPQNPPADVLVARVTQYAVGQDDAHAAARLEPVETALDK